MFEAFGDGKDKGLVDFLQRLYGVKNVFGIYLDVSPEVAAKRNRLRKTCNLCKNIVLVDVVIKKCPLCWGVLKAPDAMDPKKYKVRFDEFKIRTMPIINMLRRSGVKVVDVSGDGTPPEVFAKILKKINT
jgi:adenylate kinase family enzyme